MKRQKLKIGIVGNGFVGAAMVAGFSLHTDVRVYDKDRRKSINTLSDTVGNSEFVFICVPTPMTHVDGGEIDLSIMDTVFENVMNVEKPVSFSYENTVFVIKSTVVPGTTERYMKRYPHARIVFNPEFLTERSANLDFINASRIVLGGAPRDTAEVAKLYRERFPYTKIIQTCSHSAELIKYMCNCFFATKVSFMNEMFLLAKKLDCDWASVMDGFISDGRIGNSHIDVPGHDGDFGFGGKCFPKDINAFIGTFEENDIDPIVLKSAWKRNKSVRTNINWAEIKGAVSE